MSDAIDVLFWGVGLLTVAGISSALLWFLITAACEAFDALWFAVRCWREGALKARTLRNAWGIWQHGFLGHVSYVRVAKEGYCIPYPGYPWTPFKDEDSTND